MNKVRIYQFNNSTLTIKFGNIIESKKEVIVSSDDYLLTMGGGVSRAILQAGGVDIYKDSQKKVPAALGDVVVTTAGELPQKFVFHCVTIGRSRFTDSQMRMSEEDIEKFIVEHSVEKCFRLMSSLDVVSIAFPAIGAGCAQISYEKVAETMADAISKQLLATNSKYDIELFLFDRYGKMEAFDFLTFFEKFSRCMPISNENNKRKDDMKQVTEKNLSGEEMSNKTDVLKSQAKRIGKAVLKEVKQIIIEVDGHNVNSKDNNDNRKDDSIKSHDVFVSYSRKDLKEAEIICKSLDDNGIKYWIDKKGIYSGNNFKEIIVDAIDKSKIVLFFSSTNSNLSQYVINEVSLAIMDRKPILPIRLDNGPYAKTLKFDLCSIDWVDFDISDSAPALRKIIDSISYYQLVSNNQDEK